MAAASPTSARTARATIAITYEVFPEARSDTRIVPAIAVPNDEPRFETLRDSPEISPCRRSGKLDCTRLTEGVSITPKPSPISSSPGAKATARDEALTSASRHPMPAAVTTKPAMISVLCGRRVARRSAASDENSTPSVAAVKMTPVSMAL
jgi:hypothetical protein